MPVGTIPFVTFTGETEKALPVQIAVFMAATAGLGFTVTVTVNAVPTQEPVVGVTVYTTSMAALVVLVRVPEMLAALVPAAVPVMPVATGADQEYVVEAGTIPLVAFTGDTEKADPLQVVAVIAVTAGLGFTVAVTLNGAPVQEAVAGITA